MEPHQRKEFAAAKALGAERVGTSESLGLRVSIPLTPRSSRLEPLNLPDAGFTTIWFKHPARAAAIPSPGGLPLLGKQRKEFAAAKALGAERAGASESLGQGQGGLPSTLFFRPRCSGGFMGRENASSHLASSVLSLPRQSFTSPTASFLSRTNSAGAPSTASASSYRTERGPAAATPKPPSHSNISIGARLPLCPISPTRPLRPISLPLDPHCLRPPPCFLVDCTAAGNS